MASTGFKAIAQVAEILDRPEIDGTARHFILDLLTKTLGENIHLQDSLDEKNRDYAHLHLTLRELTSQAKMDAKAIRSLEGQVKEKDKELEEIKRDHVIPPDQDDPLVLVMENGEKK